MIHALDPTVTAFQADVPFGSWCQVEPDLVGPTICEPTSLSREPPNHAKGYAPASGSRVAEAP